MAKIFKISAYLVDPVDEFNEESLEDCLVYCTQNDIELKHTRIDSADIGEWDNNHRLNSFHCPIAVSYTHLTLPTKA